jgi:hypothetical protein
MLGASLLLLFVAAFRLAGRRAVLGAPRHSILPMAGMTRR